MKRLELSKAGKSLVFLLLIAALGWTSVNEVTHSRSESPLPTQATGVWCVTYTNGAIRTYQVSDDDAVYFVEERRSGQLQRGAGILLQFDDGKLERWTFSEERLRVEHWDPATKFPNEPPKEIGIGYLRPPEQQRKVENFSGKIAGSYWEWDGSSGERAFFQADGYVEHPGWTARGLLTSWQLVDGHTILLLVEKGRTNDLYAILLLAEDYHSFSGHNFHGGSRLAKSQRLN